jgi:hypothetical protein
MTQAETTGGFAILAGKHQYANLFTFRKSGEAVKTPVWFALSGGKIYVMTTMDAGKTKRIRNNGRVLIGLSDRSGVPRGPTVDGTARILPPEEEQRARQALDAKYGLVKAAFDLVLNLRGTERAWIEIAPV